MVTFQPYNFSAITNATNSSSVLTSLVQTTSSQVGYLPGLFVLFVPFFVLFIILVGKGYGARSAFAACSWVVMIMAIFLYPLHIIDGTIMIISILLVPISMFLLFIHDGTG